MTTLARSGIGLATGGLALAIVLTAGGILYQAYEQGGTAATTRTPKEQTYAVEVGTLTSGTLTPVIAAYGHLASGNTLELRSAVAGPLVELSENFRDGGNVAKGEVLFRIDPARLESALALARTNVAEAEADLSEARSSLELARLEAEAARQQYDLRAQAATRQEELRDRGVATEAAVEAAVLARAAAEQTLINRRQVVVGAEAKVAQSEIVLSRNQIAVADAERAVDDATVTAPFAGVISQPTAVAGRLVTANEMLGTLIDPTAMEVAFRVTNTQFARLLDATGNLRKTDVTVSIQSGRTAIDAPAVLDRAGAEVGDGQVGRLVYARLFDPDPSLVRPGDFVTVSIPEQPLADVALVPATAVTADGRLLLIGDDGRLEEITATLLRRQDGDFIVADVPFGRQYVLARALQLGPGIKVSPVEPAVAGPTEAPADAAPATEAPATEAPTAEAPANDEPATIALDDARRAAIVAFIEASENMKPEMREQFLEELSRPDVPLATVEKFEAKMAESQ